MNSDLAQRMARRLNSEALLTRSRSLSVVTELLALAEEAGKVVVVPHVGPPDAEGRYPASRRIRVLQIPWEDE